MALTRNPLDRAGYRRKINRAPSPLIAQAMPWASIMLLSLMPFSPLIAAFPIMPPLAFMALLGWRMLRPGLLPVWAGAPLGAFDDLFSGQPFGSGILLWSLAMIVMELVDTKARWRGFLQDWLIAAGLIALYLVLALLLANAGGGDSPLRVIWLQVVLAVLAHPLVTRLVAMFDRLRLLPVKAIGR